MALDYLDDKQIAGDAAGSILDTAKNAVVSVGVDFVTSLYNSTVGLVADDINTRDILTKVDRNALAFFDENKDGVEAASFLAGIIVPQAATLKLLGMAKNGVSALGKTGYLLDTFSGKRATMLEGELKTMFAAAQHETTLYNSTMNRLYAAKIGENVIDAAIFEAVAVGTMNAHPYMEDYLENPYTNFAMWAGVGGAVGSVFAVVGARNAVRTATSGIAIAATKDVADAFSVESTVAANAEKFQSFSQSSKNLQNIVETGQNEYTRQLARDAKIYIDARREEVLMETAPFLFGKDGKASEFAQLRPAIEQILADPRMLGVDKVKLPNLNFIPKGKGGYIDIDVTDPFLKTSKEGNEIVAATVFYRPSTGELFDRNLAGAAALAVDLKDFKVAPKTVNLNKTVDDWALNNLTKGKASAQVDAAFINELAAFSKQKPSDIQHIVINPDNLPRQAAALSWYAKQTPEVQATVKFNVRSDMASFQQSEKFIESGAAGVAADYKKRLEALQVNSKTHLIDNLIPLGNDRDSTRAIQILNRWQDGGQMSELRQIMDHHFRGTGDVSDRVAGGLIWQAGEAYRKELRAIADKDGYVYLYRGLRDKAVTHAPVEGYTHIKSVASSFGTANLYKVHVDNVIGRIGGNNFKREAEILVTAPHNQTVNDIPTVTGANKAAPIVDAKSTNVLTGPELAQHYRGQTAEQVVDMTVNGKFAFEEIAARLNITKEAAQLVAAGRDIAEIPNWQRYTDAELIPQYLDKQQKIVALQGNPNVTNPAVMAANLDDRFMSTAHQQMVEFITSKHHSSIANDLRAIFGNVDDLGEQAAMHGLLDNLKQRIGEINNQVIKSPMFQSLDNALRNFSANPTVTHIGKELIDKTDAAVKRVLEPVGIAMKGMRENQAALLEFNQAVNKLYSMRGWRDLVIDEDTGYAYFVQREKRGNNVVAVPVQNADGSVYYIKDQAAIDALQSTQKASNEVLRLHQLNRELTAASPINDLGFYLPPPSLVNKFYSYVENTSTGQIQTLIANTADELAQLETAFKSEIIAKDPRFRIITKGQQEDYNIIKGYTEAEAYTTYANNQLRHGGSISQAIVPTDDRFVNSIMQGYEQQIIGGSRKYMEIYLHDVTGKLDMLSDLNQKLYRAQPQRGIFKEKNLDAAMTVKNGLLGINQLNQFTTWKSLNEYTDMAITRTAKAVDAITGTFGSNMGSAESFEKLNQTLKDRGINNAWENLQIYQAAQLGAPVVNSRRVVAAANGLLGTFQLRLFELAHPLVNALSTPILASGALREGLPGTVLPNGEKINFPMRILYDAARFQFNPKGREMIELWTKEGYLDQAVRQFTDVIGKTHVPVSTRGAANTALDAVERFQDSKWVDIFTKPADFTEKVTRQFAMAQGFLMAKHAYPNISDKAATIYARSITDRIIGNYHSAQRPTMFQGTLGAALGLYQTYMLSFAQHVYRGIEKRNWEALSTSMLMQAGIFGTAS